MLFTEHSVNRLFDRATTKGKAVMMTISWRPNRLWWKAYGTCFCGALITFLSFLAIASGLIWIATGMSSTVFSNFYEFAFTLSLLIGISVIFALLVSSVLIFTLNTDSDKYEEGLRFLTDYGRIMMRNYNPVGVLLWMINRIRQKTL